MVERCLCPAFYFYSSLLRQLFLSLCSSMSLSFSMGRNVSCATFAANATVASHPGVRLVAVVFVVWERKQKKIFLLISSPLMWSFGPISHYFCRISWRHVARFANVAGFYLRDHELTMVHNVSYAIYFPLVNGWVKKCHPIFLL